MAASESFKAARSCDATGRLNEAISTAFPIVETDDSDERQVHIPIPIAVVSRARRLL